MATISNGEPDENGPVRRLRYDFSRSGAGAAGEGHSGRRFVAVSVLTILIVWGILYLVFRDWRVRHRTRAAFGASQVASQVDRLAPMVPEGVSPEEWREAVEQTHELLVHLTGANLLDQAGMERLRDELAARVADAQPENARAVLASIWDDMQARAGPVLERYPRPKVFGPTGAKSAMP